MFTKQTDKNKLIMSETEKQLIQKLNDPYYTVSRLETWINRSDNIFINAPAALRATNIKGYYEAVKRMARQTSTNAYMLVSCDNECMKQRVLAVNLTMQEAQAALRRNVLTRLIELYDLPYKVANELYSSAEQYAEVTIDGLVLRIDSDGVAIRILKDAPFYCRNDAYKERISIITQPSSNEIEYAMYCDIRDPHFAKLILKHNEMDLLCLSNYDMCAERMILIVEDISGMNFLDIPVIGNKKNFQLLRFFSGDIKRDFWNDFPKRAELDVYTGRLQNAGIGKRWWNHNI